MRIYDRNQPLIVIHVPKAAGTSVQQLFRSWFGERVLPHYYNETTGTMPARHDLSKMHSAEKPLVVYGHFNRLRKFGVEDYYPDVEQFITILRDPFELTISAYFYMRMNAGYWKDQSCIPKNEIKEFLQTAKPNMLNHFPRLMTLHNYRDILEELFIEVGVVEFLENSMMRIAKKLGRPAKLDAIEHLNATLRDQEVPDYLKADFVERNRLEYEVYNYALSRYQIQELELTVY